MNTTKLKNGKYFSGKYTELGDYRGWFVGSFIKDGHPGKTDVIEVKFADHKAGDIEKPHYHEKMIELLIFLEGKAKWSVNGNEMILGKGDFLFVDVNNVISGEYLEPTKLFALHSPSLPDDEVKVG